MKGSYMGNYCITAANHQNTNDHRASEFDVWIQNESTGKWRHLGGRSINDVNDLLANGDTVLSGKLTTNHRLHTRTITTGAAIETELRISHNGTNYKISDMPGF